MPREMSQKIKTPAASGKKGARETNASILRKSMLRRLPRRLSTRAEISIAPVPGLLEHYVQMFSGIWASMGRIFTEPETEQFRGVLKKKLEQAYEASQYSKVIVTYETDPLPKTSLTWRVATSISTVADEYANWVKTRTPPLFGKHPDAKVMKLARELGVPAETTVLDIGAGTGRNTLPLAREGFPTDAVELAPALASILREEVEKEGLKVRVFEGDALDKTLNIPAGYYKLIVLAEVVASHFRDIAHIRGLFEGTAEMLAPGGLLLFSAFLASDGYKPDDAARQLGQVLWCNIFTRREMAEAHEGLPFERVTDESVLEYEKEHLPAEAWPPTGWFVPWVAGQDLFDIPENRSPVELRWLAYRRT